MVAPFLPSLPMGVSWSMFFCQDAALKIAASSSILPSHPIGLRKICLQFGVVTPTIVGASGA